jgi:hypothetical protein
MSINTTTTIDENEYIGDSLTKINTNFSTLDQAVYTLVQTLTSSASDKTSTTDLVNALVTNLNSLYS